jgi:hypothetical protein
LASATNADVGSPPAEVKKNKPRPRMRIVAESQPDSQSQPASGNGASADAPEGQEDGSASKPGKKQRGKPAAKGAGKGNEAGVKGSRSDQVVDEGEGTSAGPSTGKTGRKPKQPKASLVRSSVPRQATY